MNTHSCPSGHRWEADLAADTSCPICTALGDGVAPPPPRPAEPLPAIPGYEVLGLVGQGGMGVVYRARDVRLDREVALKLIQTNLDLLGPRRDEVRARFQTEAQAVARLSHPNVVQIYEVGEYDGRPYLALEYVGGGSLAARLSHGPLPAVAAAWLVEALARAVQAAHERGVVHRDLKPENVLLGVASGQLSVVSQDRRSASSLTTDNWPLTTVPKITDFGLARLLDRYLIDGSGPTEAGAIVGTPSYMAPEQARPETAAVGPPADVWALGAILYAALTGRPPFLAATAVDTLLQVVADDPIPPARLNTTVPRDLETICLKCLRKPVGERYVTAAEVADDLERFRLGRPVKARPLGLAARAWRVVRRHPLPAGLLAVLFVTLTAGLVVTSSLYRRAARREEQTRELLASVVSRLTDDPRFRMVGMEPLQREMAEDLLPQVEQFRRLAGATTADDLRVGRWRGQLQALSGSLHEAKDTLDAVLADRSELPLRARADLAAAREVGPALELLARLQMQLGEDQKADGTLGLLCLTLDPWVGRAATPPELTASLAGAYGTRGLLAARGGEFESAKKHLHRSADVWDGLTVLSDRPLWRLGRSTAEFNQAALALQLGDADEAIRRYEAVRATQAALVEEDPRMRPYAVALSTTCQQLAAAYLRAERKKEALAVLDQARKVQAGLLERSPDVETFSRYEAAHAVLVGRAQFKLGAVARAQEAFQDAVNRYDRLHASAGDLPAERMRALTYLGLVQMKGQATRGKARGNLDLALRHLTSLEGWHGGTAPREWGETAYLLAGGFRLLGEPKHAVTAGNAAVRWQRDALTIAPTHRAIRRELNASLYELAANHRQLGDHADAAAVSRWRCELWPTDANQLHDGACELCMCAKLTRDATEKQAYLDEALAVLAKAVAAGLTDAAALRKVGDLVPLHGRPEFQRLAAEVETRDRQKR